MIRVVASVIHRDGKLLLCKRPDGKRHAGLWEFPGGKVEDGESDFEAVERELAEELGVDVLEVGSVHFSVPDPGSHFVIDFLDVRIAGQPEAIEHAALTWAEERELLRYPLAPSDRCYALYRLG